MAIEIKELNIKIKVNEHVNQQNATVSLNNSQLEKFKKEITQSCADLVLEKLKERKER